MEKFCPFFPNVMEAYIGESAVTTFCKPYCMIWHNKQNNITKVKLPKNPLLAQMGNFSTIVPQYYASLYIRIYTKDFLV